MNKNTQIQDLGEHGRKSRAPKELQEILQILFRTILKRDVSFQAFCVDRRLQQGELIVKAIRTERKAMVIHCWPTDNASVGGRECFVYLDDHQTSSSLFTEIHDLVTNQELRRHNWGRFVKDGCLANPIDEQWSPERLNTLAGVMLGSMVLNGTKHTSSIVVALLSVLEAKSLTQDQLEKHVRYLNRQDWIQINRLGNNPNLSTVRPGRKMIRLYAQETGAIAVDDTSEEALDRYIENGRWLQTESSKCISKIADATARLPKVESKLLRAQIELENIQREYDGLQAMLAESQNGLAALNEISIESQPVLHRMMQELNIQTVVPAVV